MTTRALRLSGWFSLGLNVGLVVVDLATRSYIAASVAAIVALACAGLLWMQPKLDALFEARLGEARAKERIADLALHAFEQQMRNGDVRVSITPTNDIRVN